MVTMTRYIAFLRAINVGGHTVKMEALRHLFETLGFQDVETFIASGNVIFQTPFEDAALLESTIASELKNALGYDVATFIRTEAELTRLAAHQAFPQPEVDAAVSNNVAFLANPLNEEEKHKVMALTSEIDHFAVHGREIYWLCGKRQSESTFSNAVLEKTLGVKSTIRGMNTITRMVSSLKR